jgi:hypothetical protein
VSDWEKYLEDPELADEPMPMREVHAIRLAMHEETKHMTPEEHTRRVNAQVQKLMSERGLSHLLVDTAMEVLER